MITPEEAIALKPEEVKWLRMSEKHIDKELREKFYGNAVLVLLPNWPPNIRSVNVLADLYRSHWVVQQHPSDQKNLTFSPVHPVGQPAFPGTEREETSVKGETRPTTWERLSEDADEILVVEQDALPE